MASVLGARGTTLARDQRELSYELIVQVPGPWDNGT